MTPDAAPTPDPSRPGSDERSPLEPYDAVLLLGFGGPEAPDEVMPFLRRVTAGRGIPDERLEAVGEHYHHFGGRSPINDQNRALIAALRAELDARGIDTPIVWGNRNSAPFIDDALRESHAAGHRRVVALTTSAYSCYSSCRQYRENLADAAADRAPRRASSCRSTRCARTPARPGFAEANAGELVAVAAGARRRARLGDRAALRHALHPRRHGRHVGTGRRRGQPLPAPAPGARVASSPRRPTASSAAT